MTYFTKEYNDFFKQLARNNKREWFHAHKKEYEKHVKDPFAEFVDEMIHRVGKTNPDIAMEPRDAIFRIARDIRFAKDKTPYKTYMAAAISPGGKKGKELPGLYFSLGAEGVHIGGGVYQPDAKSLLQIRRAIKRDGKTLASAMRGKAFKELFGELQGERNKRLPREFADKADRFPFIANKQFFFFAGYEDPKYILKKDLAAFIMKHYRAGKRVSDFLKKALA